MYYDLIQINHKKKRKRCSKGETFKMFRREKEDHAFKLKRVTKQQNRKWIIGKKNNI